jgi:hypothetical protein
MLTYTGMYKTQYTPEEAQEQFRLIDESSHHQEHKDRVTRYIQRRVVETLEVVDN